MKRFSKYLVLLLAVLVVAVCFVGCADVKIVTFKNIDDETLATAIVSEDGKVYEPKISLDIDEEIEGWYTNKEGTGEAFNFSTGKVEANLTLYVKIRTATEKVVTFKDSNEEVLSTVTADRNGKIVEPKVDLNEGFTLDGWYLDKEYTGTAFNFETGTVTESMTLYAKISTNRICKNQYKPLYRYICFRF